MRYTAGTQLTTNTASALPKGAEAISYVFTRTHRAR